MAERIRLGYVKEVYRGMEIRSWVADQDMTSKEPVVVRDVQRWLYGISHPLSETAVQYLVHPRFNTDEKDIYPDYPWMVEYFVPMYDQVSAIALGYGKTPEEAVMNVRKMVQENVEKYLAPVESEEDKPTPSFDMAKFMAEVDEIAIEQDNNT